MPSLRQTSATATPVSACCNANTICASVNLDFFMAIVRLHPVINCPFFSILFWQGFSGEGQSCVTANLCLKFSQFIGDKRKLLRYVADHPPNQKRSGPTCARDTKSTLDPQPSIERIRTMESLG